ncbi:MAG: hypothetical protein NT062_29555 [Proteobacteria bacterium]|nr:hypothetical protein [Pseudomonadota bacterium]
MPINYRILTSLCLTAGACSSSNTSPPDVGPIAATAITGTLGDLGPVQATVSSLMISNSGETLIYLSSATLTCEQLAVSRWLGSATADSQVIELIVAGTPSTSTSYPVPPGEVNFAQGGKSSATETSADSGSIAFSRFDANASIEGTVSAKYGSNHITGVFKATFCPNGQGY